MTPEQRAAVARYERGEAVPVTELPSFHMHPECGGLQHGHGDSRKDPEPHTHLPIETWGEAVPVEQVLDVEAEPNGLLAGSHEAQVRRLIELDDLGHAMKATANREGRPGEFRLLSEALDPICQLRTALDPAAVKAP